MEYCNDTLEPAAMNVGEYWVDMNWGDGGLEYDQNGPRQAVCDFISSADKALPMFDFPTKGILQEAVKNCEYWRLRDPNNKPTGVLGWWPSKSVTFVDNHDTGALPDACRTGVCVCDPLAVSRFHVDCDSDTA